MKELSIEKAPGKKGRQKKASAAKDNHGQNDCLVVMAAVEQLVSGSAAFRRALLETFDQTDWVEVDCSVLQDADPTFFQILCAANHSATRRNKRITIRMQETGNFNVLAAKMGLERHVGCSRDICRSCIWTGGGEQ